jgi:hypothetical protein
LTTPRPKRFSDKAEGAFSAVPKPWPDAPFAVDAPRLPQGAARWPAALKPRHHSYYPPCVAILHSNWKRAELRPQLAAYYREIVRHFRRVVIVSKDRVAHLNDAVGPFPPHCFHKSFPTTCWHLLLQQRIVRLSGGLLSVHGDTFFDFEQILGAADNAEHIVLPRQHQNHDARKRAKAVMHPDGWGTWPLTSSGTTRSLIEQRNRIAEQLMTFAPSWLLTTPNGSDVNSSHAGPSDREATDSQCRDSGFVSAVGPRILNTGDLFYLPDRGYDIASWLLESMLPTPVSGEPSIGWLAEMIYRATGGNVSQAVSSANFKARYKAMDAGGKRSPTCANSTSAPERNETIQWRHVPYAGGCCATMDPATILSDAWAAGHKVRLQKSDHVIAMTARLLRSFNCRHRVVAAEQFLPSSSAVVSLLPTSSRTQRIALALNRTACQLSIVAKQLNASIVLLVAPHSRFVDATVEHASESLRHLDVIAHTPNARLVSVRLPVTIRSLTLRVRTGVTKFTPVTVGRKPLLRKGSIDEAVALDLAADELVLRCARAQGTSNESVPADSQSIEVLVETEKPAFSTVAVTASGWACASDV